MNQRVVRKAASNASFILNRRSINNSLSRNRNISVSQKLALLKSYESIRDFDRQLLNQTEDQLVRTIAVANPLKQIKRKRMAKNKIIILKVKDKSGNTLPLGRSFEVKKDDQPKSGMLPNVQNFLFPSMDNCRSRNGGSCKHKVNIYQIGHISFS